MPPIKVLLVDDSALIRRIVSRMLEASGEIKVIDVAVNGREAVKKISTLIPDVVSLDLEMPVLDGLGVLRQIMPKCPVPVVMLSAHTTEGARATMQALSLGAVDFVAKPAAVQLEPMVTELIMKIKEAAQVSKNRLIRPSYSSKSEISHIAADKKHDAVPSVSRTNSYFTAAQKTELELVIIGSSTGGPAALQSIIPALPAKLSFAVVVVQHLPVGFSKSLADHLQRQSQLPVKHAESGQQVVPGQVLVAPAGSDLTFYGHGSHVNVRLEPIGDKRQPGSFYPSVDVVMSSAADTYSSKAMGILLTGMGKDGAKGMGAIYKQGGITVAEDENTCVVFGMPKAAIDAGVVRKVLPLGEIAGEIVKYSLKS